MEKIIRIAIITALAVLATACSKPEKQLLEGSWQWAQTSGGIAGVNYTPENEGFKAEIVFKGNKFTFYKDGKKVTSGNYQIDGWETNEEDEMPHPDVLFRSTIRFPEATCKEISKATDGKISLYPSSIVLLDIITEDYQSLTFHSNNMVDDFWVTFGKK